jgi:2-polyprenyl-3-methyl-5-hydroxy-6-metoxy-1,4-benzoquinol methylase
MNRLHELKEYFNKTISSEFEIRGDISKLGELIYLNHYMSRFVLTTDLSASNNILEIGCGDGKISSKLARILPKSTFTCIDLSEKLIKEAKTKNPEKNINYLSATIEDLDPNKKFDLIFSFSVLQYISPLEIKDFNKKCNDLLTNQGSVIHMSVPKLEMRDRYHFKSLKSYLKFQFKELRQYKTTCSIKPYGVKGFWHSEKSAKCELFPLSLILYSDNWYRFDLIHSMRPELISTQDYPIFK